MLVDKNRFYEFVLILNPRLSSTDIKTLTTTLEDLLEKWSLLKKDDIGLLNTAYPLKKTDGAQQWYYLSYYLSLPSDAIARIKEHLRFEKNVLRHYFFQMNKNQPFYTYEETQKKMTEIFADDKVTHI